MQTKGLSNDPPDPVAFHRIAGDFGRDGETEARQASLIGANGHGEKSIAEAPATGINRFELRLPAQAELAGKRQTFTIKTTRHSIKSGYGMSFLRPFARRRLRTLRPFAVAMRARNPCVRARRTLLG